MKNLLDKLMSGSWQTTIFGLILLAAAILKKFEIVTDDVFLILLGIAGGGMGYVSRDNGKSSEDVGASK